MADVLLPARPVMQDRVMVGTLTLALLPEQEIVSIGPFKGHFDAVTGIVRETLGVMLSDSFQEETGSGAYAAFRAGHNQWFCRGPEGGSLTAHLATLCEGHAAVTNQTDSRVTLLLSGPGASAIATKLVPVDLHPSVFKKGRVALTLAGHIPVVLICRESRLHYEFMVFRSLAQSLFDDIYVAMNGGVPNSERV